jgi:hypothetical protein
MDDEDLFAVENPDGGEMSYCSILGSGGEEFGLGMFVGEDGYDRYAKLMAEEVDLEDFEESMMMRSISMLFVDRDTLQKKDRGIIRSLDLRFRGRNAWPFFRSQQPGYVPWFLEKGESVFLTAAIQQSLVVADEVRGGELDLSKGEPRKLVLARYYRSGKWHEEWRKVPTLSQGQEPHAENIEAVKEAGLHLLRGRVGGLSGCWEIDIFALPMPIGQVPERPHFPICFLAVEAKLGLVLGANLTEPWLSLSQKQDEVIQMLRKANQLPREIRVKSDKVRQIMQPITSVLGIKLQVGPLPMLEQAKSSLYEHFSGRLA